MKSKKTTEIADLRTPPIYNERAFPVAYGQSSGRNKNRQSHRSDRIKETEALKVGTQSRLQQAALLSYLDGKPLNTLVTIRSSGFPPSKCTEESTPSNYKAVKKIVESLRKWLTRPSRRQPVHYIWCREVSPEDGEHVHIGLYLHPDLRGDLIDFFVRLLPDPVGKPSRKTRGEIARGAGGNWHIAVEKPDNKPQPTGYWIASYLGKGEPSQRVFRGQLENNQCKCERGRFFDGRIKGDRYDKAQGTIAGNDFREGRYDISRSILKLMNNQFKIF